MEPHGVRDTDAWIEVADDLDQAELSLGRFELAY